MIRSGIFIGILLIVAAAFRFSVDYFGISLLSMNAATRIFSKGDAIKIISLGLLFFGLYYRDELSAIRIEKQKKITTIFYFISGFLMAAFYYFLRFIANYYDITAGFYFYLIYILSIIVLLLASLFFAISVFSKNYIVQIFNKLKKPLFFLFALIIISYFLMMKFQSMWPYFVYFSSKILFFLFQPFYSTYLELHETPILDVNGFTISIGAPCSGIESLFLFLVFLIGIFVLDSKRINIKSFMFFAILGIVLVYFVNVLRLYLLILSGIHISPDFALGVFHTNLGWVLFVGFFILYYYIIRKFIYKKSVLM